MKNEEVLQRMNEKKKADQYLEGQETEIFWGFDTAKYHIQNTVRRIYRWK